MPIHCSDLTDIIYNVISKKFFPNIIECVGPETFTFKEILENLLKLIDKKRILLPFLYFLEIYQQKFYNYFLHLY